MTGAYEGIYAGAGPLAGLINALPAGDVNVVAHSHGGNVAIIATGMVNRQINHLVELATPVNEDLPRYVGGYGVRRRCIASSWSDHIQFGGAAWWQITGYAASVYLAFEFGQAAADAWLQEDYEAYWIYVAAEAFWYWQADSWWASTKIEWTGTTVAYGGLDHGDMHEPGVWFSLPSWCKTN